METMTTILFEIALKSVCLMLLALFTLWILRDAAPSLRHRLAVIAFALLAILPLCAFVPGGSFSPFFFYRSGAQPIVARPMTSAATEPLLSLTPPHAPRALPSIPSPAAPPAEARPTRIFFSWSALLPVAWATVTGLSLLALAGGLGALSRLRRAALPAAVGLYELTDEVAQSFALPRPALRLSEAINVPLACGVRHPAILLPAFAADWDEPRLRAALLHEMAHIARRDFAAQTCARVVCALYAWNPLVWRLFATLRADAEADCDQRAIAAGIRAADYAHHLFEIACHAAPRVAAPAMAYSNRPAILEKRIRAILMPCYQLTRRRAVLSVALGLFLGVPTLAVRPIAPPQPVKGAEKDAPPPGQNSLLDAQYPTLAAPRPAPMDDATAFLQWSMDQYAAVKTFRADWTWDTDYASLPKPEKGKDTPRSHRTLVYAAPNQFKIVSRMYEKLSHTYISDGTRMVIVKRGYGQGPEEYAAPPSLARADRYKLPGGGEWGMTPDDGDSALYRFFGGGATLPHLLDTELLQQTKANAKTNKTPDYDQFARRTIARLSGPAPHFGPDVTIEGEPCKMVVFNGSLYNDERRAAISVRDGFIRRIEYLTAGRDHNKSEQEERLRDIEQTLQSPMIQKMSVADRNKLREALMASVKRDPDALSADVFSHIRINEPVINAEFDTADDYPAVGKTAPEVTVYEQTSGRPLRLSDLRGQVALLVFSSHDTASDDIFLLTLPKLASQLNLNGVVFAPVTPQIKVLPGGPPLYRDPTDAAYDALDISGYSTSFIVIDREGKIAYRGTDTKSAKEIQKALNAAGIPQ